MIVERENGTTYFWLTIAESNDKQLLKRIDKYCEKNSKSKYDHVIFMSGSEDLVETIGNILLVNKYNNIKSKKQDWRKDNGKT